MFFIQIKTHGAITTKLRPNTQGTNCGHKTTSTARGGGGKGEIFKTCECIYYLRINSFWGQRD